MIFCWYQHDLNPIVQKKTRLLSKDPCLESGEYIRGPDPVPGDNRVRLRLEVRGASCLRRRWGHTRGLKSNVSFLAALSGTAGKYRRSRIACS